MGTLLLLQEMLPGTHTHAPRIPPIKTCIFPLLTSCLLVSPQEDGIKAQRGLNFPSNVSVQGSLDNLGLWFYFLPFQRLKEYELFRLYGNVSLFQFILPAECLITASTLFKNSTNCEVRKC